MIWGGDNVTECPHRTFTIREEGPPKVGFQVIGSLHHVSKVAENEMSASHHPWAAGQKAGDMFSQDIPTLYLLPECQHISSPAGA